MCQGGGFIGVWSAGREILALVVGYALCQMFSETGCCSVPDLSPQRSVPYFSDLACWISLPPGSGLQERECSDGCPEGTESPSHSSFPGRK